ncbi:MAG: hypothetical protein Q9227_004205 [Pyrenula ochraceoflavens]
MASGSSVLQKFKFRSERKVLTDEPFEPDSHLSAHPLHSQRIAHRSLSSSTTTNSDFPGEDRKILDSQNAASDPLGLQLVSDVAKRNGDIIFVHGLGGSSWKTWSWNRDVHRFWPIWLTESDDFASCRIFTFGYNSNWKGGGTNLNISDFAKDLLLQMLTFKTEDGSATTALGNAPIIFVAHSMGGLVVKKAYLLGKLDDRFSELVSCIHGMMFLGTPHRGAQLASTLNSILSSSPLGPPPKAYISDIQHQSNALQEINEQFRHRSVDLELIVEKDSAVLQYPREISSPLHADHHTICKFRDLTDQNYVIVRNTLRYWIARSTVQGNSDLRILSEHDDRRTLIQDVLGVRDAPEDDLSPVRSRIMSGSYQWFTHNREFVNWMMGDRKGSNAEIFWLFGLPATGKTAISSVVIDRIETVFGSCQFHFFSASHQAKKTAAYCLRAIATQLAQQHEHFRERLFSFHADTGIRFSTQDQNFDTIWEKIFEGIIFKMDFDRPLLWILDAIDEVDQQALLIGKLTKIQSVSPIKIFLSSRPTKLPMGTASYGSSITSFFLSETDTKEDLRSYITNFIRNALPTDEKVQHETIDKVLTKASGSFLWVRLALESLEDNWHTQDDILTTLTEVPVGMVPLYQRMVAKITSQPSKTQLMAQRILTWVSCSWRPLRVDELKTALEPEFKGFLKFEETVQQVCGHFVTVDKNRVSLIHATARQFLTEDRDGNPSYIHGRNAHQHVALCCLRYLSKDQWRRIFQQFSNSAQDYFTSQRTNRLLLAEQGFPLLGYATCYWAYHASKSPTHSKELVEVMHSFFKTYSLSWIEAIALSANLRYLTRSARYLKTYAKLQSRSAHSIETLASLQDNDEDDDPKWIQKWSTDLIRMVGKFGSSLVTSPTSIYRNVAPFCPRGSMMGKTFGGSKDGLLSVTGLTSDDWDDCLATVSVGEDEVASKVLVTETWFITLVSSGTISIWYSETCELARTINVGDYVLLLELNRTGSLLTAASSSAYTVWEVASGKMVYQIPKRSRARAMAICFEKTDSRLLVGMDDCSLTVFDLPVGRETAHYQFLPPNPDYAGCPKIFEISPDQTKVAMAWRGRPPLVWHFRSDTRPSIQRCRTRGSMDPLSSPEALVWQPDGSSLLVICLDMNVVDWNIYDDHQISYPHVHARQAVISRDMNLLLSYDNTGTISVWSFPRLTPLYKLVSENEFIRDIAFSPDSQRIYDTRGSTCNIWEPDALVRPEEDFEDRSSIGDMSFASSEPVVALFDTTESPITALAVSSDDDYYCCGRDNGVVSIHNLEGKRLRKVYGHSASSAVLLLAWSNSGRYMASADDSARVIVKRLEVKERDKWAVFAVLDLNLVEPVRQFVFSPDERLLLAATLSGDQVYSLKSKQRICSKRFDYQQNRLWLNNLLDASLLIRNEPSSLQVCSWHSLETMACVDLTSGDSSSHSENLQVEQKSIFWTTNKVTGNRIIYGTLPGMGYHSNMSCLSHNGLCLHFSEPVKLLSRSDLLIQSCVHDFASQIKRLVGTFEGRVVYLDHDYWLCTWDVDLGSAGSKRHFFLPKDWVNANSLHMVLVNDHGTLLFPRHGYVAIVRNGIGA